MTNRKRQFGIVTIAVMLAFLATACATLRVDPSNRAEQVNVTFNRTIK